MIGPVVFEFNRVDFNFLDIPEDSVWRSQGYARLYRMLYADLLEHGSQDYELESPAPSND